MSFSNEGGGGRGGGGWVGGGAGGGGRGGGEGGAGEREGRGRCGDAVTGKRGANCKDVRPADAAAHAPSTAAAAHPQNSCRHLLRPKNA